MTEQTSEGGALLETDTTGSQSPQPIEDRGSNRSQRPASKAFREFIARDWADRHDGPTAPSPAASYASEIGRASCRERV